MKTTPSVSDSRDVERVVAGRPVTEGAGVKLLRVLTADLQRRLDPFLLLDEFRSDNPDDYIAGFPNHPHRGFETVTYMLAGRMRHRDNAGHEGLLRAGGVQWMTAGRGIVHSEIPEQEHGLLHGFQLWVNLPAARKMIEPSYRDIPADGVPQLVTPEGVTVKVIAGTSHDVQGVITRPDTEPLYLDISLPAGAAYAERVPVGHNSFLYVYSGAVSVGPQQTSVSNQTLAILKNQPDRDGVALSAIEPARLLLIAGRPLGEPIVQSGPFVMNTREEVEQAFSDYRDGLL